MSPYEPIAPLHTIPIAERPSPSVWLRLHKLVFLVSFVGSLVVIHLFQLVGLPLAIFAPPVYRSWISHSKVAFSSLLLAISSLFAPTSLKITAEGLDLDETCQVNQQTGETIAFEFDQHSVWISNHQCYLDWIIIWIMFFLGNISSGLIIILKGSLQWAPVVGPAMQLFRFVFLDKKKTLQNSSLGKTAQRAVKSKTPFALTLFPEGTLVSRLTRPKSASYAAMEGIPDHQNLLLPRSTGLLYCLRTLSLAMPNLTLYDITMGYEGVAPAGYAQDYYTLGSTFGLRVPSPRVHLHLRKYRLADIPIGSVREGASAAEADAEVTQEERKSFERWLRQRWDEKDTLLNYFYTHGAFPEGKQGSREVAVKMRGADWAILGSIPLAITAVVLAVLRLFF